MALDSTAQGLLGGILDAINNQTRSLEEAYGDISDRRDTRRSNLSGKSRGEINRERKTAQQQASALAENAKKIDEASTAFAGMSVNANNAQERFRAMAMELRDSSVEMSDALRNDVDAIINATATRNISQKELDKINKTLRYESKILDKVAVQHINYAKDLHKVKTALNTAEKAVIDFAKRSVSISGGMAQMGAGAIRAAGGVEESLKRQAPLMDSTSLKFSEMAAMYKLSATDLMGVTDEYSGMLLANARDGSTLRQATAQYLNAFGELSEQARELTGNYNDGNRLLTASFASLSRLGIDTTFETMKKPASELMSSMQTLARITGRSAEEIGNSTKAMMQETDIRNAMLQLSKKDRVNFVNKLIQDQTMLVAKGMEIEQAEQAVKALRNISGQDPREKLKEAARMAAVASSMGVEGGQQMIQLAMKPIEQWSKQEKIFAQRFATELKEREQAGLGAGGGEAMTTFALMQRAKGGPFFDAINSLQTAGLEGQELTDETLKAIQDQKTVLEGGQLAVNEGLKIWQTAEAFFKDPGAMMFTGFASFAAGNLGLLTKIAFFNKGMGKSLSGLGGTLSKQMGKMMPSGVGTVGGASTMLKGTAATALAAYAAKNVYELWESGGKTSSVYETFAKGGVIEKGLHGLFDLFTDEDEKREARQAETAEWEARQAEENKRQIELQERMVVLMEAGVEKAEAHKQVTVAMAEERKRSTEAQIKAQKEAARQARLDEMTVAP